jgi:hypothetical protein
VLKIGENHDSRASSTHSATRTGASRGGAKRVIHTGGSFFKLKSAVRAIVWDKSFQTSMGSCKLLSQDPSRALRIACM